MKKINWSVRLKNRAFWLAMIPAVLLLIQAVGSLFGLSWDFGDLNNKLRDVVNAAFVVLAILGIVNDPTTATFNDSTRVMSYTRPKREEDQE